MNKLSFRLIVAGLLFAVAFSAALPSVAYAQAAPALPSQEEPPPDNGVPADPPEGEEAEAPAGTESEEPAADGEQSAEEASVAPAEEQPAGEEMPAAQPSASEGLPENTTIVIVGEDGQPVSPVTEEAAEILAVADPIWCPSSVAVPKPGMSGCTTSYTNLTDLLLFLTTDQTANPMKYHMDGTIWIEKTYDSGTNDVGVLAFTLDGSVLDMMKDHKLTIKGGWNGCSSPTVCVGTIDMSDKSEFNARLEIINWENDVTLSDLYFTTVASGLAVQVGTTGNIMLTRVDVQGNTAKGAHLDNTAGAGNVTVTSSTFNNNGVTGGIQVASKGAITLTSVIADSNNGGYGAYLENSSAATAKNVVINNSEFNSNDTFGIYVLSKGLVSAANLTASYNGQGTSFGDGVSIDNTAGSAGVTLTGVNIFLENFDTGLYVLGNGPISVSNVFANSNINGLGVYVNTSVSAAGSVTFSGTNEFKFNDDQGARIQAGGAVTMNNVTASHNGGAGLEITTYLGSAAVTVTGTNVFYNNAGVGLQVGSLGAINISSVTANSNSAGLELTNWTSTAVQPITLSGTNVANSNVGYGVFANSKGAITLNSITANGNGNVGLYLHNNNGLDSSKQGIKLTGVNSASGNSNGGIHAQSFGTISINSMTASNSSTNGDGMYLDNSAASTPQSIALTGTNVASSNRYYGLRATSKGAISISNLTANFNGLVTLDGYGAHLDNASYVGALGGITLSGTNVVNGNHNGNVYAVSRGAISVSSLTANNSVGGRGAYFDNTFAGAATPQNVTISGVNSFSGNYATGFEVLSYGTITANSLAASNNGLVGLSGSGAILVNNGALTAKAVTLTGTNVFETNHNTGLLIQSKGVITVSNVTSKNVVSGHGASLTNSAAASPQNVSMTGTNLFVDNDGDGLRIVSVGAITVSTVTATGNGTGSFGNGAYLDNTGAASTQNVTVTGTNIFSSNSGRGLDIRSKGAIATSNVTASSNSGGYGAYLDNSNGLSTSAKGVTLTGTNIFNSNVANSGVGLYIETYGAISINSVTANNNGSQGASLTNSDATGTPQNVTVSGTNIFTGNWTDGLVVTTLGTITTNNLNASNNAASTSGYGASLTNASAATPKTVTMNGTNTFSGNVTFGLQVMSKGTITISNLTASNNTSGSGAYLQNTAAPNTAAQGVKLTGTNVFSSNSNVGLVVESYGAISVNNLTASSTTNNDGATLTNNGASGPQSVTITGTNVFNLNQGTGLAVNSLGAVSLSNATANGNGTDTTGHGVYLANNNSAAPQSVVISGVNSFSSNGDYGLIARSKGAISLASATASGNADYGAFLENNYGLVTSAMGVTLTGTNVFSNSTNQTGLYITSYGAISLNNVVAETNTINGAVIDNSGSAAPQKVALTGTHRYNDNDMAGVTITSKGAISSATSLTANSNGGAGAMLSNGVGGSVGGVSLAGANQFNDNADTGLDVDSFGVIIMNNVTANGNGTANSEIGADLSNSSAATPMNVTMTGINTFTDNYAGGLAVYSDGVVSLNSVTANSNDDEALSKGVLIDNSGGEGKAVNLTGTNNFLDNSGSGLQVYSHGAITLNSVTANENGASGVDLQNYLATAQQAVKLLGTNTFIGNIDTGLQVTSIGAITANNLTAIGNFNGGVSIDNDETGSTSASTVTLTGTHNFSENIMGGGVGLRIRSVGIVTLSKLTADDNSGTGVNIATSGNVTLACASINSNFSRGLDVTTLGVLTLKGVISSGNGGGNMVLSVGSQVVVRSCP